MTEQGKVSELPTLTPLQDRWRKALWEYKNSSNSEYGDFPDDLMDIVITAEGLERPEPGSALEEYIHAEMWNIEGAERYDLEQDIRQGEEEMSEVVSRGESND